MNDTSVLATIVALKAIIVHNGKALIVQRADDETYSGQWEFVGGKLEFGEDLEAALRREVHEETGLEITQNKLLYATSFMPHAHKHVVFLTYLCKVTSNSVVLSAEHQAYEWADAARLQKMLLQPILDGLDSNNAWDAMNLE